MGREAPGRLALSLLATVLRRAEHRGGDSTPFGYAFRSAVRALALNRRPLRSVRPSDFAVGNDRPLPDTVTRDATGRPRSPVDDRWLPNVRRLVVLPWRFSRNVLAMLLLWSGVAVVTVAAAVL